MNTEITVELNQRGVITIPKRIREDLNLNEGDELKIKIIAIAEKKWREVSA